MGALRRLTTIVICLHAAALVGAGTPGVAASEGTGGDVCASRCGPAPAVAAQSADKDRLERVFFAAAYREGSLRLLRKRAARYAADYSDETARRMVTTARAEPPAAIVLKLRHVGQANRSYCGPAAGVMMLRFLRAGRSAANGARLQQHTVAGRAHMRANDGATEWQSHRFRIGLNRWLRGRKKGYYTEKHDPTGQEFRNAVVYNIGNRRPMGADTVEFEDGAHYNGHPRDQTIGHWIVPHGYVRSGAGTRFADSSTTVWPRPKPKFSARTGRFARTYLNLNGIVR